MKTLIRFLNDENGNATIQYGMVTTLVTGAMVGPLTEVGTRLNTVFTTIARALAVH